MPYALETSKRKFERILEAISDELGNGGDRTKKRRLTATSVGRRPLSKLLTVKALNRKALPESARKPTTFNPFDRDQFRKRLRTFRSDITLWSSKSEPIGEAKWAARGWELVGKNKVECKGCSKHVLVDLGTIEVDLEEEEEEEQEQRREEAEANLVAHYEAQIVDGHEEGCPWRKRGCASLYRVHFNGFNNAVNCLRDRFESLTKPETNMPSDVQVNGDLDVKRIFSQFCARTYPSHAAAVPSGTEIESPTNAPLYNDVNSAAFTLALYGWARDTGNKDPKNVVIRCDDCFARVGLWMYEHIDASGQLLTGGGLQPTLDASEVHYDDCPWINAATQQAGSHAGLTGMESKSSASDILATFLNRTGELASNGVATTLGANRASPDRDAQHAADKQRFKRVRELTRAFHMSKARKVS